MGLAMRVLRAELAAARDRVAASEAMRKWGVEAGHRLFAEAEVRRLADRVATLQLDLDVANGYAEGLEVVNRQLRDRGWHPSLGDPT